MPLAWDDEVDEVLGGDAAAGVAYPTPAKGVVITPMSPLGLRDRERGTVTVTTSLGLWKKVARIRADPSLAVAYHAREHGLSTSDDFILVQGRASVQERPDRTWLESITPQWERFLGPRERGWRGRLMDVYYWNRIGIEITIERIMRWRSLDSAGEPEVIGEPLPPPPEPQPEPAKGTEPRVDAERLQREGERLPHTLVGWVGGDGLPLVVGAHTTAAARGGAGLELPSGLLPPGGRRAGLTAHAFAPRMQGQEQRIYTGWIVAEGGGRGIYAPHTRTGNRLPASRLVFDLGAGLATRAGLRAARKAGVAS